MKTIYLNDVAMCRYEIDGNTLFMNVRGATQHLERVYEVFIAEIEKHENITHVAFLNVDIDTGK